MDMEVDDPSESLGEDSASAHTSEDEDTDEDDALGHILIQNPQDVALLDELLAGDISGADEDDEEQDEEGAWGESEGEETSSAGSGSEPGESGAVGGSGDASTSDSEAGSEATDSDDQYRRATTRKVSRHATAMERSMSSGVVADLPTATQRGCLLYARPDVWGAFDCNTKAQHFQTMDCLAVIPPPPPPSRQAAKPAAGAGSAGSSSSSRAATGPQAGATAPAQPTAGGAAAAPGAAAPSACAPVGPAAAAGAPGSSAPPPLLTLPPPPVPAEDEPLEVLIGGPQRLSVCRVPAPGQPGGLQVVCSAALQTNHYSLAVSPDGRFIAAGGDRGFLYIFAYQRGTPQQPPQGSPQDQAEARPSSSAGAVAAVSVAAAPAAGLLARGGKGPPQPSPAPARQGSMPPSSPQPGAPDLPEPPARLVRLVSFAFPVRGGFWGMNNNIRFGCFGGALRLLVAAQDKAVYIFNVPAWDGSAAALPALADYRHFTCGDLQRWTVGWATNPPPFLQPPPPSYSPTASGPSRGAQNQAAAVAAAAAAGQPQQPQTLQAVLAAATAPAPAPAQSKPAAASTPEASAAEAAAEAEERRRFPNRGAQAYWRTRIPAAQFAAMTQPDISLAARTPCFSAAPAPEDGDGEDGAGQLVLEAVPTTAAIVDFPTALNCAEPSPDGRWLAVGCDEPLIYLVPAGPDYMHRPIEVLLAPLPGHALPGRLAPGCQYVKFNERSDRLAASFDSLFSVLVWDVPQRQLIFTLRHQQWQPPLALSFVPTPPPPSARPQRPQAQPQPQAEPGVHMPGPGATAAAARAVAAAGATSSLLLHATDRQHIVAVDVDAPRTTLTRLSIKPRGQREGPAVRPPLLSPEPTAQQLLEAAAQEIDAAQAAGGAGAQADMENLEQLLTERAAALRQARQRERERRARRRARRPPHINGLLTTADGRLLVATNDEILTFRLLTPATPWSAATHRLMPPAFRAAVRTLLLAAAGAGAGSPSSGGGAAATAAAEGAGNAGPSARPTGLSSLPHDAIEHIIAEAAAPRVAWAHCEARDVLAFPTLDIWAEQPHQRQREAGEEVRELAQAVEEPGGADAGPGPSGCGKGAAGLVVGWDQDPWQAWDVTNREA